MWLAPLVTGPHPSLWSESHLITIKKGYLYLCHHLGNPKRFRSSVPVTVKTKYLVLIINHDITARNGGGQDMG